MGDETFRYEDSISVQKKQILIGTQGGYRVNIDSKPDFASNGFFGFSVDIPISSKFSFSSGIGFGNFSANHGLTEREYSIVDIPLLLTFTSEKTGKGLDIFIGSGLLSMSDKSDKLITLNLGTSVWYGLTSALRLIVSVKYQKAGSLEPGGGNSITSIYFGSGIKIQINVN